MYKCQLCGEIVPKGTACRKVILETRNKEYPARRKANQGYDRRDGGNFRSNRSSDKMDDYGGVGHETAKEVNACEKCAQLYKPVTN